nr:MAG TPA: RNAse domain protein [Caudoviricetes sp.]
MTDMRYEIVDAVVKQYKGADEDIAADCLVYLSSLKCLPLAVTADTALESMGRCTRCGTELERYVHRELHTELDEPCYETLTEVYCPNCDIPYREGTYVG